MLRKEEQERVGDRSQGGTKVLSLEIVIVMYMEERDNMRPVIERLEVRREE